MSDELRIERERTLLDMIEKRNQRINELEKSQRFLAWLIVFLWLLIGYMVFR